MDLPLEIPGSDYDALVVFLALSEIETAALVGALKEATPTLSPMRLAKDVAARVPMDLARAKTILRVLRSMYRVRATMDAPLPELVEAICSALGAAAEKRKELRVDGPRRERFKKELGEILSLDETLGVSARGMQVMQEHERTLCTARLLTDARPVFRPDVSQDPAAMVLSHTLCLDYHTRGRSGQEVSSFYVAADASDLRELRRLIDRALAKEATMRRLISSTGVRPLPADDEEGGHGH